MTLYDFIAKSNIMQRSKRDMINNVANHLKRDTQEIKRELEELEQQGGNETTFTSVRH